ncbi:MAG: aspartate-semialdehyde dehydrogenase, partial [Candidatus Nanopelagicales bacterium]
RMEPDGPLVVPEVNPDAARDRPRGIISNPNCTTLSMIVVLGALHRRYSLKELVVASYQAASGAGQAGIDELREQIAAVAADGHVGERPGDVRRVVDSGGSFPAPLALNVVPWAGSAREGGYTSEEFKVRNESRKILALPDLRVAATCVRVPVITTHSLAIHAVFDQEVDQAEAQDLLERAESVVLVDDPLKLEFPTPIDVVGTDPTYVGRVRKSVDDPFALDLFVCGDNLRKGAALNTAQIAELIAAELTH